MPARRRICPKKRPQLPAGAFLRREGVCKPGSVVDNDLSGPRVAARLKPPFGTRRAAASSQLALLRIGFTWRRGYPRPGELLPRLSILTAKRGGIFLLHFPSGRPGLPLAGIPPCEARTFLTSPPKRGRAAVQRALYTGFSIRQTHESVNLVRQSCKDHIKNVKTLKKDHFFATFILHRCK